MTPRAMRIALVPFLLVLVAAPWLLDRALRAPAEHRLGQALFGATPGDGRAAMRALPHRWGEDCADCVVAWYRFDVATPELGEQELALLVPAQGDNAAVYLNGRLIGQGGRFADPVARLGPRPLLASAPPSLWNAGGNELHVAVKAARPGTGFMSAPALGPETELRRLAAWRERFAATLPQVLATAAAILGVAVGALWLRRRDADYAAYAIAALAWALFTFGGQLVEPPSRWATWDAALAVFAALAALTTTVLCLRVAGRALPRALPRTIAIAAVVIAIAVFAEPSGAGAAAMHALSLVLLCGSAAWLAWRERSRSALLCGAAVAVAGAAAHDFALAAQWSAPEAMPALALAGPLLVAAIGWRVLLRFAESLNAAEILNIDLEALVQARTAELGSQFERVRSLEHERSIAAERERVMREMHDGVGGHLVSMLAMLEGRDRPPPELEAVARQALDDMRLMIDSLEPVDDDLNAVLAMFRERLAPRLRAIGMSLDWDVELLPPLPNLTPARALHVLRILQEAVTNAMRHGRAHAIGVAARCSEDAIVIVVYDDGVGFVPRASSGRGLANLRRRSAELDAALDIDSAPGRGTRITLRLLRK